jgi:hypothetical protein
VAPNGARLTKADALNQPPCLIRPVTPAIMARKNGQWRRAE